MKKMKKIHLCLAGLLLAALLVLDIDPGMVYAGTGDFSIHDGVLTNYVGPGGNVVIPGSVREIGEKAFAGAITVNSVTIPASVKKIGADAFSGCSGMTRLTLNKGLTTIGDRAFHGCANLGSVTLPSTLSTIGNGAFEGCVALKKISIPKAVRHIPENAFQNCSCLQSVTLPSELHSIGAYAFMRCRQLKTIIIPGKVTSIADGAFEGCEALSNARVPASTVTYGTGIFSSCSADLIIWGKKNSAAHKYADSYMITFHSAMSLSQSKLTLSAGKSRSLKLKQAVRKVQWKSSKKSVATVSSGGKVTGRKKGTATIYAVSAGQTFKCKVTVK